MQFDYGKIKDPAFFAQNRIIITLRMNANYMSRQRASEKVSMAYGSLSMP